MDAQAQQGPTVGDAIGRIEACQRGYAVAGNFEVTGALQLALMTIRLLLSEVERLQPKPAVPPPAKEPKKPVK